MRAIDADALEKEGWSLHRTIRVDKNTSEYQTKPLKQVPTIEPERVGDPDRIYTELSKVYNTKGLSDEVYSIIGDLMLSLHEPERKKGKWTEVEKNEYWGMWYRCSECGKTSIRGNFCPNCGADMREEN